MGYKEVFSFLYNMQQNDTLNPWQSKWSYVITIACVYIFIYIYLFIHSFIYWLRVIKLGKILNSCNSKIKLGYKLGSNIILKT